MVPEVWERLIESTVGAVPVTVTVSCALQSEEPCAAAVIVAVPELTAVITPLELTVATLELLVLHVTALLYVNSVVTEALTVFVVPAVRETLSVSSQIFEASTCIHSLAA